MVTVTGVADVVDINQGRNGTASSDEKPAAADSYETAGAMLKAVREDSDLTLEQVSQGTNVKESHLQSIEEMAIDRLPARPFTIGFVKSYAEFLDLPVEELVTKFKNEAGFESNPVASPVDIKRAQDLGGGRELSLLVVVGIVFFILWCAFQITRPSTVVGPIDDLPDNYPITDVPGAPAKTVFTAPPSETAPAAVAAASSEEFTPTQSEDAPQPVTQAALSATEEAADPSTAQPEAAEPVIIASTDTAASQTEAVDDTSFSTASDVEEIIVADASTQTQVETPSVADQLMLANNRLPSDGFSPEQLEAAPTSLDDALATTGQEGISVPVVQVTPVEPTNSPSSELPLAEIVTPEPALTEPALPEPAIAEPETAEPAPIDLGDAPSDLEIAQTVEEVSETADGVETSIENSIEDAAPLAETIEVAEEIIEDTSSPETPIEESQTASDPVLTRADDLNRQVLRQVSEAEEAIPSFDPESIADVASAPATLINSVQPIYPARCASSQEQDIVMVMFDVSATGNVINQRVTESTDTCFNAAALVAISRWQFTPAVENGNAVLSVGQATRFRFKLPQ